MITEEQALEIAKQSVPDLEDKDWYYVSERKPDEKRIRIGFKAPEKVWTVFYSPFMKGTSHLGCYSSNAVIIDRETGRVAFNGDINDEG